MVQVSGRNSHNFMQIFQFFRKKLDFLLVFISFYAFSSPDKAFFKRFFAVWGFSATGNPNSQEFFEFDLTTLLYNTAAHMPNFW